jgi:predicted dienelactone hydrolase
MRSACFAGYTKVEIELPITAIKFPLHIFYPTNTAEQPEQLGPFTLEIALNCVCKSGSYPLVIFSHGSGSMPLLFRGLGQYLARNGFIVGMPEHPFNNRIDNSAVNTLENFVNRPLHLQTTMNWFFDDSAFKSHLIPNSVSLIGHSLGGYTALALAGGVPTTLPFENILPKTLTIVKDPRIKNLVLLAPATVLFRMEGALANVDLPILIYSAELDNLTPGTKQLEIVLNGVKNRAMIKHKIIPNAGHFSFMSVYSDELKSVSVPPSQDPPGFNRQAFLDALYPEIVEFLREEI